MTFDSGVTSSELASLVALARIKAIDFQMVNVGKLPELYRSPRAYRLAQAIVYDLPVEGEDKHAVDMIRSVAVIP